MHVYYLLLFITTCSRSRENLSCFRYMYLHLHIGWVHLLLHSATSKAPFTSHKTFKFQTIDSFGKAQMKFNKSGLICLVGFLFFLSFPQNLRGSGKYVYIHLKKKKKNLISIIKQGFYKAHAKRCKLSTSFGTKFLWLGSKLIS